MERENADIVIGSKKHPQSKVHYPFLRRLMSFVYQTLNHLLFNLNVIINVNSNYVKFV